MQGATKVPGRCRMLLFSSSRGSSLLRIVSVSGYVPYVVVTLEAGRHHDGRIDCTDVGPSMTNLSQWAF